MASVPTGTPAGICTMERSESTPRSTRDSTGTPSTGSVVFAAAMLDDDRGDAQQVADVRLAFALAPLPQMKLGRIAEGLDETMRE